MPKLTDYADLPQAWGDVPNVLREDPWKKRLSALTVLCLILGAGAGIAIVSLLLEGK